MQMRSAGGEHLILYDSVCGLCNRLLQFVFTHDHRAVFSFASLQSRTGQAMVERFGGDPRDLGSFYVFAHYRTSRITAFTKGRGALFVTRELVWPWKALCVAGLLPTRVLDFIYDLVAGNRFRIFDRSETCVAPTPDIRRRFVE